MKYIIILFLFMINVLFCQGAKQSGAGGDVDSLCFMKYPELAASENLRLMMCYKQSKNSSGVTKRTYPKHFGGVYRDITDLSKSVILLTDTSLLVREKLIKLCRLTPEKYIFKLCKYSMNELGSVFEQLSSNSEVLATQNVGSVGINEKCNRVRIRFNGKRDEGRIVTFKSQVLDSPMLEFWFEEDGYLELKDMAL